MKTKCLLVLKSPNVLSVCLLALLIGGATIVHAQDRQVGVNFLTVVPRGEFSENLTNNGYGVGIPFLFPIRSSPFLIGGDLGFVVYGSESSREPISATIPNLRVSVHTGNFIFLPHFVLRAQRRTGPIRPYVDGLIGLKFLWTETSIEDASGGEAIASDVNLSDTAFSYGIGGGLQIPLTKGPEPRVFLDTGVRYLRGGRAAYLRKGSIAVVNGSYVYDVFSSRTDVLTVQVGVAVRF